MNYIPQERLNLSEICDRVSYIAETCMEKMSYYRE